MVETALLYSKVLDAIGLTAPPIGSVTLVTRPEVS